MQAPAPVRFGTVGADLRRPLWRERAEVPLPRGGSCADPRSSRGLFFVSVRRRLNECAPDRVVFRSSHGLMTWGQNHPKVGATFALTRGRPQRPLSGCSSSPAGSVGRTCPHRSGARVRPVPLGPLGRVSVGPRGTVLPPWEGARRVGCFPRIGACGTRTPDSPSVALGAVRPMVLVPHSGDNSCDLPFRHGFPSGGWRVR